MGAGAERTSCSYSLHFLYDNMKIVFLGFVASCVFGGFSAASPIADNTEPTPTRDWNMPLTTELVDFGKTGFLFKRDAEPESFLNKKMMKRGGKSGYPNSGKGTFFTPNKGSCGWKNSENDLIVAVSGGGGKNPNCGRTVEIVNAAGSKVKAKVVDTVRPCI